jgi:RNA polymerase sigma-70 factor (ECF subfamily)
MTDTNLLPMIEACIPALRRYASALLRQREEADDLVHDCLVRALNKLHTKRHDSDVRAWLFTIMHNLFVSQRRSRRIRPVSESLEEHHDGAASIHPVQENGLHWRDLLRELYSLPEEQRQVILLVSVEDLSYAETAAVLGVPIGTVMSRLARGRERLRERLDVAPRPLRRVR